MIDSIDPQAAVIIGVLATAAWIWIEVICAQADR